MAFQWLNNIDMTKNQILNLVLHKATNATIPTGSEGQVYYNEDTDQVYYHNGTAWVSMSGDITDVVGGTGLSASTTGGVVTLNLNVDDVTVEVSADTLRIKDGGVSTAKLADDSVTTIKLVDNNVTFEKIQDVATMKILGRVTGGAGNIEQLDLSVDGTFASNSDAKLVTEKAIKTYVDSRVSSLGNLEGGFDASTLTAFPVGSSPDAGTQKGDYWYVTGAGTVNGITLNIGDVLIANQAAASTTNANHWIFLESNRDQATTSVMGVVRLASEAEAQADYAAADNTKAITAKTLASRTATETRIGIAAIATQAQVTTGTDDATIVTPLKLKSHLDTRVGGYTATVGDGEVTSFVLTHGLNTKNVIVDIYEDATGNKVGTDIQTTTVGTVTVSFSSAPSTNQYRVVIKK